MPPPEGTHRTGTGATVLLVASGGALGAVLRVLLTAAVPGPAGVWVVNVLGAAALGLLDGGLAARGLPGSRWRPFLGTGVLGGFTTFSALAVGGPAGAGPAWLAASLVVGAAAAWAGRAAGLRRHPGGPA